jgi:hypothetical protein
VKLLPGPSPAAADAPITRARGDLRLLYFASIAPGTGELAALTIVPMQARNMRLRHASAAGSRSLAATLGQISRGCGSRIEHRPDGRLIVHPAPGDDRTVSWNP